MPQLMVTLLLTLIRSWGKPPPGTGPSVPLVKLGTAGGAKCLDGSPGALYFRAGSGTGTSSWLIHHEGGGWCTSLSDCIARATTPLGSSHSYRPSMYLPDPRHGVTAGGYFSVDPTENPLMHNWNMAYLKYCDGLSFSGLHAEDENPLDGAALYFRGSALRDAMQQELMRRGADSEMLPLLSSVAAQLAVWPQYSMSTNGVPRCHRLQNVLACLTAASFWIFKIRAPMSRCHPCPRLSSRALCPRHTAAAAAAAER